MTRKRSDQGWRAAALAAALFAITLNFLQPLAHAAMLRDGGPATWAAFCLPAANQADDDHATPTADQIHECCLGLAQAPLLGEPSTDFVAVEPPSCPVRPLAAADALTPVGIRDGPAQPRAPPFPT